MDSSADCQVSLSQGADKICISQQCNLSNALVCQACEQSHEHNGSILAVRIAKVRQMHQKITKTKKHIDQISDHMLKVREQVTSKIDKFLSNLKNNNDLIADLTEQLDQYLSYCKKEPFHSTWSKVKQNIALFQEQANKKRNLLVSNFQNQLISILKPQKSQSNKQKQNISHEHFLDQFSNIFSYLGLQLRSKPTSKQLQQIKLLKPSTKTEQKLCAKLYELSQEPQTALEMFNNILKYNSLDIETINRKALLLKRMKKYKQAYDQFTILIDLVKQKTNPEYYHFHRGQICRQLGKYQQALNEYKYCTGKDSIPQYKIDHSTSLVYFKQAKHKQAIELFKKLIQVQELSKQDKNQIHQCLVECGKLTSDNMLSLESLNALRRNNPEDVELLFKRARVYHEIKDYKSAIKDYSQAIQRVNNIPGLYYNRAVQIIQLGEKEQALPDLKKAIELDPNFKEAVHLLANTCFQLLQKSQTPEAAQHLKILAISTYGYSLKFYPNNEGIWHNLAILQTEKNPQKAYECYSRALQINPKLGPSYLGKIKTSILLKKDPKETMRDVETLISLGDRTVPTYCIKSVLEEQMGMYQQALQTANLVLKADPENQAMNESKQRLTLILEQKSQTQKKEETQ